MSSARGMETYRRGRREHAKLYYRDPQTNTLNLSFSEFWALHGDRYYNGKDKRRLGIKRQVAQSNTYTSNGAREVARRLRRMKKGN